MINIEEYIDASRAGDYQLSGFKNINSIQKDLE
jgi:hypothetical protein